MIRVHPVIPVVLALAGLIVVPAVSAAADDTWLRDQLRQTTVDLRRLQDENAALQAKLANAGATQGVAAEASASRAEVARARGEARKEVTRLQAELQDSATQLAAAREAAASAQAATAIAQREAAEARGEREAAQQAATACLADNRALADTSLALLRDFRDRGLWDALRQKEPLTGVARARHEALVEKYRVAIRDAAHNPPAAAGQTESAP